ncbi:UNVERIFIED_CONTAM: hypothetical protein GTU68_006798 [Idotea baltica]|nr:hypothetical protein [Idotea baltica]
MSKIKIAIVGSGPSAFFAADMLLKKVENVEISIFEKLSEPYGLVRFGVAPDHAKIRSVTKAFEKTLQKENVTLFCNKEIGKDISLQELRDSFNAVILAYGAQTDRALNIPGEDLAGSYTATAFVAWYNGHQEFTNYEFDLSGENAIIIGQGNVAVDVVRILAKDPEDLKTTDIAEYAVTALKKSNVKNIYMIGRRGPVQAAFTDKELRELGELKNVNIKVNSKDLELNEASKLELESNSRSKRNYEILKSFLEKDFNKNFKTIHLKFFLSPTELTGDNKVNNAKFIINKLEESITIPCEIFMRSIGYRGLKLENLPFNEKTGTFYQETGRINDENGVHIKGLYTTGWIKRGPSGVIGTNKACSNETVRSLIEDLS